MRVPNTRVNAPKKGRSFFALLNLLTGIKENILILISEMMVVDIAIHLDQLLLDLI